jgi:hypothetical protein
LYGIDYMRGPQIFHKSRRLQIPGARRVTRSTSRTGNPQFRSDLSASLLTGASCAIRPNQTPAVSMLKLLGTTVRNLVVQATVLLELLRSCYIISTTLSPEYRTGKAYGVRDSTPRNYMGKRFQASAAMEMRPTPFWYITQR